MIEVLVFINENVEIVLNELWFFLVVDGGNVELVEIEGLIVNFRL